MTTVWVSSLGIVAFVSSGSVKSLVWVVFESFMEGKSSSSILNSDVVDIALADFS